MRHNLSMNPHFRKGGKAKQGSGHLWVLADYDKEDQLCPQLHVPQFPQQNQQQIVVSVNETSAMQHVDDIPAGMVKELDKKYADLSGAKEPAKQQEKLDKVGNKFTNIIALNAPP